MDFLDIEIAKMQKNQEILRQSIEEIDEEVPDEVVPEVHSYERLSCFNHLLQLERPVNFFETYDEKVDYMIWNRLKVLTVMVTFHEIDEAPNNLEVLVNAVPQLGKKQDFYMEVVETKEEWQGEVYYQYIKLNIPTAIGDLYQSQYALCLENKRVIFTFTYKAKLEEQLNPLITYMIEHIKWQGAMQ